MDEGKLSADVLNLHQLYFHWYVSCKQAGLTCPLPSLSERTDVIIVLMELMQG